MVAVPSDHRDPLFLSATGTLGGTRVQKHLQ